MSSSVTRFKTRMKTNASYYVRCGAKTLTFLFWASLYMVVMKMTIFKSSVSPPPKDWEIPPDNYTKWLGPVIGDDPESDTSQYEWPEIDNATVVDLENRAGHIQKVCRAMSLINQPVNSREFFVDRNHNLVWCNIFKAASSFWLYKFNILGGYDKHFLARAKQIPLTLARKKFPRPSEEELRDAINTPGVISLLVVREPFVRLLSAYRDKLENNIPFYRKIAKAMMAENREKDSTGKTSVPTFFEFVSYLIANRENSFSFDEHWAPYYKFCSPCALNFSVIAKVETLARDTSYVIQQLGLGQLLVKRPVGDRRTRLRTVMNKSRDGRNTTALLRHYFSQIDENMLEGLLEIYGVDFEMFGYNANIYRDFIKK